MENSLSKRRILSFYLVEVLRGEIKADYVVIEKNKMTYTYQYIYIKPMIILSIESHCEINQITLLNVSLQTTDNVERFGMEKWLKKCDYNKMVIKNSDRTLERSTERNGTSSYPRCRSLPQQDVE